MGLSCSSSAGKSAVFLLTLGSPRAKALLQFASRFLSCRQFGASDAESLQKKSQKKLNETTFCTEGIALHVKVQQVYESKKTRKANEKFCNPPAHVPALRARGRAPRNAHKACTRLRSPPSVVLSETRCTKKKKKEKKIAKKRHYPRRLLTLPGGCLHIQGCWQNTSGKYLLLFLSRVCSIFSCKQQTRHCLVCSKVFAQLTCLFLFPVELIHLLRVLLCSMVSFRKFQRRS